MNKEWNPQSVLDVLGCPIARDILALASEKPISASEIAEHCEVSPPTIYRRIAALERNDMIDHQTRIDDHGHHCKEFFTDLGGIQITIEDGIIETEHVRTKDYTDRFSSFWDDLGSESVGLPDTTFAARRDALPFIGETDIDG